MDDIVKAVLELLLNNIDTDKPYISPEDSDAAASFSSRCSRK